MRGSHTHRVHGSELRIHEGVTQQFLGWDAKCKEQHKEDHEEGKEDECEGNRSEEERRGSQQGKVYILYIVPDAVHISQRNIRREVCDQSV